MSAWCLSGSAPHRAMEHAVAAGGEPGRGAPDEALRFVRVAGLIHQHAARELRRKALRIKPQGNLDAVLRLLLPAAHRPDGRERAMILGEVPIELERVLQGGLSGIEIVGEQMRPAEDL